MAVRTTPFYPIQGMEEVLRNLNRVASKVAGATKAGLVQGGFLIQREAQKLTPVDLGNLRSSAYTVWSKTVEKEVFLEQIAGKQFVGWAGKRIKGQGPIAARLKAEYQQVMTEAKMDLDRAMRHNVFAVEVGFTAYYAIYVHEDLEAQHPSKEAFRHMTTAKFKKGLKVNAGGELAFQGGGEAKFLQKALEQNAGRVIQILVKKAKIK